MSDFTTQLRFICESYAGVDQSHPQTIDDIIANSRDKLFDFSYPIFDEAYKPELETKIINHFYTQEIGQETVGLFKQRLKTKMREIMPYYNQLYMSERLKFDPFKNADYVDLHNSNAEGKRDTTSANTASFNNSTVNDVDNTHHDTDASTGTNSNAMHEFWKGKATDNSTNAKTGSVSSTSHGTDKHTGNDTISHSGDYVDINTKDGTDMGVSIPAIDKRTLVKQADTPLGGVQGITDESDARAHVAGVGPGGINDGYLSGIQETVDNFTGGSYKDGNEWHPRNHDYTETRYGVYYNLNPNDNDDGWYRNTGSETNPKWEKVDEYSADDPGNGAIHVKFSEQVKGDQRRDIVAHINGQKMEWVPPMKGENPSKHGHWKVVDGVDPEDKTTYNSTLTKNGTTSGVSTDNETGYKHEDTDRTTDRTDNGTSTENSNNVGGYHTDNDTVATGVSTADNVGTENTKNKQDYFGKIFGKVGSETYSEMLNKFRSTFLNIDMDVIYELEPLFMLLW